jgi:hypothetical protein
MDEFVFKKLKTGEIFRALAVNSDVALLICIRNTGWTWAEICYEGRAAVIDRQAYLLPRDELKYIPGCCF